MGCCLMLIGLALIGSTSGYIISVCVIDVASSKAVKLPKLNFYGDA